MPLPDYTNTDVWDIVSNIEDEINKFLDVAKQTADDQVLELAKRQYPLIIDSVVYQMSCLPVDREAKGLEPLLRQEEVQEPFNEIVEMIATVFGIPTETVSSDMVKRTELLSASDLRMARKLRNENMLH